jgi:hypothetical protein
MNAGFQWAVTVHRGYNTPGAPATANASVTVASTNLTAGSLTIAAQPDVSRQLAVVVNPGTSTLTAGTVTMTYAANDGTTQTDVLAFGPTAVNQTLNTTKGVEHLTSAVVGTPTYGSGAGNGGIIVGTNATLALPVDPGFVDFAVTKETVVTPTAGTLGLSVPADETIGTVTASGGLVAPTTAPNGSKQFQFDYSYVYPG